MKWEIGKAYSTKNGIKYRVVVVCPDGKIIVERVHSPSGFLSYRTAEGKPLFDSLTDDWDLIKPDEPTAEERKIVAEIHEAYGLAASAEWVRTAYSAKVLEIVKRIIREGR
jgi:hypothetical protein